MILDDDILNISILAYEYYLKKKYIPSKEEIEEFILDELNFNFSEINKTYIKLRVKQYFKNLKKS